MGAEVRAKVGVGWVAVAARVGAGRVADWATVVADRVVGRVVVGMEVARGMGEEVGKGVGWVVEGRVGWVAVGATVAVGWEEAAAEVTVEGSEAGAGLGTGCPAECLWTPPCLPDPLARCRTALRCPTQPSHCWQGCYPAHPRMLARCL